MLLEGYEAEEADAGDTESDQDGVAQEHTIEMDVRDASARIANVADHAVASALEAMDGAADATAEQADPDPSSSLRAMDAVQTAIDAVEPDLTHAESESHVPQEWSAGISHTLAALDHASERCQMLQAGVVALVAEAVEGDWRARFLHVDAVRAGSISQGRFTSIGPLRGELQYRMPNTRECLESSFRSGALVPVIFDVGCNMVRPRDQREVPAPEIMRVANMINGGSGGALRADLLCYVCQRRHRLEDGALAEIQMCPVCQLSLHFRCLEDDAQVCVDCFGAFDAACQMRNAATAAELGRLHRHLSRLKPFTGPLCPSCASLEMHAAALSDESLASTNNG